MIDGSTRASASYTAIRELSRPEGPHLVTLAHNARGATVVLKRLRAGYNEREDLALRLRLEAEILRELGGSHGIVELVVVHDEPFTLVMDYVSGGSLADRLSDATAVGIAMPASRACSVASGVLDAIAHLHANGVVHRDIKPSNVLFAHDGTVRLIDLGVAARSDPARGGARHGLPPDWIEERVGTLPYAAPESVLDPSAAATPAQDVYGLAVLLIEMLTGSPPWHLTSHETAEAFAERRVRTGGADVPLLSTLSSAELSAAVAAALHPDPSLRPSVGTFAAALGGVITGR